MSSGIVPVVTNPVRPETMTHVAATKPVIEVRPAGGVRDLERPLSGWPSTRALWQSFLSTRSRASRPVPRAIISTDGTARARGPSWKAEGVWNRASPRV
jgi:hypothetical protein